MKGIILACLLIAGCGDGCMSDTINACRRMCDPRPVKEFIPPGKCVCADASGAER
jgi:hypothetical protein